jgi:hypothetical protein
MVDVNVTSLERHRRPLTVAACLGVIGLLYVAYLSQSRSLGTDADGASNVLQAWDMLHGNVLLRGWWLSDVSFYTTELPEYMLVELARGLNSGVINAAGAATYTILIVLAAVLAKGRATGTAGLLRALMAAGIMLAPAPTLLSSPNHTGTQVPLLLIWLVIDRLGAGNRGDPSSRTSARYLPWLVGALLTWVEVADQLAIFVAALPVIVVSAIRICQRRESWRADAGLLAGAVASVVLAMTATLLIRRADPAPSLAYAGISTDAVRRGLHRAAFLACRGRRRAAPHRRDPGGLGLVPGGQAAADGRRTAGAPALRGHSDKSGRVRAQHAGH